jgi:hypothetical protein
MNHMKARQLSSGGWRYTNANGDNIYPSGYCVGPKFIQSILDRNDFMSANENERMRANLSSYHEEPHATAEEAIECYRTYLLDSADYDGFTPDVQRKCAVCDEWTQRYATIRQSMGRHVYLCALHLNRGDYDKFVTAGESWGS